MTFDLEGIAYTLMLAGLLAPHGFLTMHLCARHTWAVPLAGAAITYLLLREGSYWSIFPRGVGFWTANRTSAGALYFTAFCGPLGWQLIQWHLLGGREREIARVQRLRDD